jgi:hypothetical protein
VSEEPVCARASVCARVRRREYLRS